MSMFLSRALQKAREHFRRDKTGLTLLRYSTKLLVTKLRRRVSKSLAAAKPAFAEPDPAIVRVSLDVAGGIGDYVVIARAVKDLAAQSPDVRFDVFCPFVGVGQWVFGSLPCVDRVLDNVWFADSLAHVDCALHVNQYVYQEDSRFDRDKLARLAPDFLRAVDHGQDSRREWGPFIERRPTRDSESARLFVSRGLNRYSFLHSQLGIAPGGLVLDLECDYDAADDLATRLGKFVTINTGFDGNLVMASRLPTKCYPTDSWTQVVRDFHQRFPDIAVVQIGGQTSIPIEGVDANLVGSTSLAQAAGVLRRALLHVDCDGGLVHIAAALGVKCVALFGPTPWTYFGYPGNVNVSSGYCGDCWWATEGWMERCPIGFDTARCMDAIPPSRVLEAIEAALNGGGIGEPDPLANGPYALPQAMVAPGGK